MIRRRTILAGAAALPLAGLPFRQAWAPPPPPPPAKGVYAVHFGGATRLMCPASNLDFPYSSQFLFVHCKYKANSFPAAGAVQTVLDLSNSALTAGTVSIVFKGGGSKRNGEQIWAAVRGPGKSIAMNSPLGSVPWDTNWHDLKMTVDAGAGVMDITIDDASIPGLTYLQGSGNTFQVSLQEVIDANGVHFPLTWAHGGNNNTSIQISYYTGDFEDLFVAAPLAYVDIRNQAVKDAFYLSGVPIYLPDDGANVLPSGDKPQILLHGPASYYGGNLAKSDFTWPATQTHPGEFVVNGAALAVPANDAWGFVGV